jgi:hypothetical protein
MNIQKYLLLPIVFGVAALSAQAQLLDDTFTSGTTAPFKTTSTLTNIAGIGTQSPPSSAEWFGIGSSSTNSITYNTGVGIKSAPTPSNSQGAIAYFEAPGSQFTMAVGQTLTASMTFQYASAPINSGFGIHFSLLNSNSTGSQNNQTLSEMGTTTVAGNVAATNYSGYYAQLDPNASTTTGIDSIFYRPTGSNTSWVGSNTGSTPLDTSVLGPIASLGTDKYKAVLTLTEASATTMTLGFNLLDETLGGTDVTAYDIAPLTTSNFVGSFDTFTIGLGSSGPVTVSEASVVAIPEPSTYAAILGAATLGLVAFRSRRQRRLSVA